jgi:outer membrane protein OmpA-like peptidoglycan-associated protein
LYGLRAESEGQISENQNIDLRDVKAGETLDTRDFNLAPIETTKLEENAVITMNNIFFDFDKSLLKPESAPELDRLVNMLKEQTSMKIEISGHTDDLGTEQYNLALSERRAKNVIAYLVRSGIDQKRISVQYFGESKPVDSNETEEGRQKNRRVEFKILKL